MELQTGIPTNIALIGTIQVETEDLAYKLEEKLHKEYNKSKIRGEWFSLESEEQEQIIMSNDGELYVGTKINYIHRRNIIVECGDASYILYEYYKEYLQTHQSIPRDNKTSVALGWDISKAKRIRLKLEKAHYIKTMSFSHKDGRFIVTYLGKDNIAKTENKGFIDSEILVEDKTSTMLSEGVESIYTEQPEVITQVNSDPDDWMM